MSESHQREAALFDAAIELPTEERAAYLDQACGRDAALRQRIESLLEADQSRCEFLDPPTDPELRPALRTTVPPSEKPGDRIGCYKLLERIGEGGCGVVYVAEQTDFVHRSVALKIIKLGMDTKSVVARFEAERQALALMDHPNIATVFDAGATETGRPYFVMELVRGMKITGFCDEKKLSTNARLDLFMQVCQAIQHAHQKGIIHRDIKPSNILVTVNDGVAVPKVIDFGVAKATGGQQLTDKTVYTAFEQFIGTPAYMSPEQAVLTSMDVDTRSDIYALGVLLYELLTGKTPFEATELLAIGLDEMRRTIREQQPERPSTRISALPGQELSSTAHRRGLEPPKLVSDLRGDLDWIVMKCLEKDRARRYETASGLSMDIQRHLDHEPVVACPPSRLYRFQKLVRRNKLVFAAAGAVAASLVIGLSLSTVLFFRERASRQRADEQAAIAQAVNDFLQTDLLRQAASRFQAEAHFTPDPNLTVREALERAAEQVGDRFKDQPLQEAAVRMAIAEAFYGVGEYEQAEMQARRALELRQAKLEPDHPEMLAAMYWLACCDLVMGKVDQALPRFEETLQFQKSKLGPDHPDTLKTMGMLFWAYKRAGEFDQAVPLCEETLELTKARPGSNHYERVMAMRNLAFAYEMTDKREKALSLFEETLELSKTELPPGHPLTLLLMGDVAHNYGRAGKPNQALSLREEALRLHDAVMGHDHPRTLDLKYDQAVSYARADHLAQALPLFEETVKGWESKLGPDHPDTLNAQFWLADVYMKAGRHDQARPLLEKTLENQRDVLGPNHEETLKTMYMLAVCSGIFKQGRLEHARDLLEEALEGQKVVLGPDHYDTLETMWTLACVYRGQGEFDQAVELLEDTLRGRTKTHGPDHAVTRATLRMLTTVYRETGKLAEAEARLRERLIELRQRRPGDPSEFIGLTNLLKDVLLMQKKYTEAEQLFDEVVTDPNLDLTVRVELLRWHGHLRARWGEFAEAAADLVRVRQIRPDDPPAWHQLAPVLVASGQLDAYREHCRQSVERFGQAKDPNVAERIAKSCLILPDSGVDPEAVARLADTAAAATDHPDTPWFQFVKGLADYRQAEFMSAIEWLNKTLMAPGAPAREVEACMVLAMAHYELKQTDEARATFARGAEIEQTKLPKLESGDLGGAWIDWIIAHALMDEAKALIESGGHPTADTK